MPCQALLPILFLLFSLTSTSVAAKDSVVWAPITIHDTCYLPLENLCSFYKLLPIQKTNNRGGSYTVGTPDTSISFGPGKRDMFINGYRCQLTHPIYQSEKGELMVSQLDVVKLIEPILRPTYIQGRHKIHTVIIDPAHGGTMLEYKPHMLGKQISPYLLHIGSNLN